MDKDIEQQVQEMYKFAEKMYKKGYVKGCEDRDTNSQEMYEKGLNDAWECVRKIINQDIDIEKVFCDASPMSVFSRYTASEAVSNIKEWERRNKNEKR